MLFAAAPTPAPSPLAVVIEFIRAWPLIGTVLLAVIPLYWPSFRWSRRLKSDSDIYSKLPPSPERDRYEQSILEQARRLYLYRETIGRGKYAARSALAVSYASALPLLLLIDPQGVFADGWPTVFLILAVGIFVVLLIRNVWRGRTPSLGLDPYGVIIRERLRRYGQRVKRLHRLDKLRRRRFHKGLASRGRGSRLGFSTAVDPLAVVTNQAFRDGWGDIVLYQRSSPAFRAAYAAAVRSIDGVFDGTDVITVKKTGPAEQVPPPLD